MSDYRYISYVIDDEHTGQWSLLNSKEYIWKICALQWSTSFHYSFNCMLITEKPDVRNVEIEVLSTLYLTL
jgi:hypothetical protein